MYHFSPRKRPKPLAERPKTLENVWKRAKMSAPRHGSKTSEIFKRGTRSANFEGAARLRKTAEFWYICFLVYFLNALINLGLTWKCNFGSSQVGLNKFVIARSRCASIDGSWLIDWCFIKHSGAKIRWQNQDQKLKIKHEKWKWAMKLTQMLLLLLLELPLLLLHILKPL